MTEDEIREEMEYLKECMKIASRVKKMCLERGNIIGAIGAQDDIFAYRQALKICEVRLL